MGWLAKMKLRGADWRLDATTATTSESAFNCALVFVNASLAAMYLSTLIWRSPLDFTIRR